MIASYKTRWIYISWNFADDGYFVENVRGKTDVNWKKDARIGSKGRNSWRQVVHVVQIDVLLKKLKKQNKCHSRNWKIIALRYHRPDNSFASNSLLTPRCFWTDYPLQ